MLFRSFNITTGDLYTTNAFLSVDIDHERIGDLEVILYSPDDKKVVLYAGEGANQGTGCAETSGLQQALTADAGVNNNDGQISLAGQDAATVKIGSAVSPAMSNYVIPFRLPTLKAGEKIRDAHLTTFLEGFVDDNGDNIIPFKLDRKSTRLNSSHSQQSRMPSSA